MDIKESEKLFKAKQKDYPRSKWWRFKKGNWLSRETRQELDVLAYKNLPNIR